MRSTESGFNQLVYLAAAEENLTLAEILAEGGNQVTAAYLAGVAVECLLMAYETRQIEREIARDGSATTQHDSQHDLRLLERNSRFFESLTSLRQKETLAAALYDVALRWRNNHRYRSEKAYRDWVVKMKLNRTQGRSVVREDAAVYNTAILLESALRIIEVGVARWSQT